MIAKNYRKFPEALIYQLELALAEICNTFEGMRIKNPAAFTAWTRIMAKATDNDRAKVRTPEWVTVAKRLAAALARKVKSACMALVESNEESTPATPKKPPPETPARTPKMIDGFYYGPMGETWSGRGLMPKWLRTLVQNGQDKRAFLYTTNINHAAYH